MGATWFVVPSARPPADVNRIVQKWLDMGYCVALQRDPGKGPGVNANAVFERPYQGYSEAVNWLTRTVMDADDTAEWIVTGGDDTEPDLCLPASHIAEQCKAHFGGTYGVMQPTGDRWGANEPWALARYPEAPAYIDRICGSPWMGREFCRRMYAGNGPMWHEYFHMFNDSEMQDVCQMHNLLWQRRDLIHLHHHVHREGGGAVPEFLTQAYSRENWIRMERLYLSRKAANFPGHEPIA